jgi:hypothetical protein
LATASQPMGRRGDRRPGELVRAQRRPRAVLRRMDRHRPAARARRAVGGAVGSGQSLGVRRLPSRPTRRAANHDLYGVGCPAHLGISPIDKFIKDGGQFVYTVPARLDGDGTFAQVRLPMGVTADMVADRRDRLAANLGTPSPPPDQHQHPRGRHKQPEKHHENPQNEASCASPRHPSPPRNRTARRQASRTASPTTAPAACRQDCRLPARSHCHSTGRHETSHETGGETAPKASPTRSPTATTTSRPHVHPFEWYDEIEYLLYH